MTTEDISQALMELGCFMSKEDIKLLSSTLAYAVSKGEVYHKDGFYVAVHVVTQVLNLNRGMWKVLKDRHPEVMEFVKIERLTGYSGGRGGSAPNLISHFGIFYLAALSGHKGEASIDNHPPIIYIYRDPGNKALKVGVTVNMKGRKKNSLAANPFLKLLATFEVSDTDIEKRLHRILVDYAIPNTIGWFSDTNYVRAKINRFLVDNCVIDEPSPSLTYRD